MNVSSFKDSRIMTMLQQSYNFDADIVVDLSKEALQRSLITEFELDRLLKKNEIVKRKQKQLLEDIKIEEPESFSYSWSRWVSLFLLFLNIFFLLVYGFISGWLIFATLGSLAKTSRDRYVSHSIFQKAKFKKRF